MASRKSANESMSQSSYGSTMDIDMLNMDVSSQRPRAQQKRPIKESKGSRRTANIPTGTIAAKKLKYNEENCIPPKFLLNVKLDGNKATNKEVSPVYGEYIVDLSNMVATFAEIASCKTCHGELELFEMKSTTTCSSKLMFRCKECLLAKSFWNVGKCEEEKPTPVDTSDSKRKYNRLDYSSVLAGRIIGLGIAKLKHFHGLMNIPPPPISGNSYSILKDLVIVANKVAEQSMDKAKEELALKFGIDGNTKCVHSPISFDGAYSKATKPSIGSKYCFASAVANATGKVVAYKMASNRCKQCTHFQSQFEEGKISQDNEEWNSHKGNCQTTHHGIASSDLESHLACDIVRDALTRGMIFPEILVDGDNDTIEKLNASNIYNAVNIDIRKKVCVTHLMRSLMNAVYNDCNSTREIAGKVAKVYNAIVQRNLCDPRSAANELETVSSHFSGNHGSCPLAANSWCKYQADVFARKETSFTPLDETMATNIGKCLRTHGFTNAEFIESIGGSTNPNESIHRILFDMTSKRETVGMDVMRLGAALAVIRNNDGFNGLLNILDTLFNSVPVRAKEACRKHDNAMILASERNIKCQEETSEKK